MTNSLPSRVAYYKNIRDNCVDTHTYGQMRLAAALKVTAEHPELEGRERAMKIREEFRAAYEARIA